MRLHKVVGKTFGDSRGVENAHQHGRDLLRGAKHSTFGDVAIYANTLRSGALEERKEPTVSVSHATKAGQGANAGLQRVGISTKLTSKGYKLPKKVQTLMAPKNKDHTWPSPAMPGLFESLAATEWLFTFQKNTEMQESGDVNGAWLSGLVKPGFLLAQKSTSMLTKAIAAARFGFLWWAVASQKVDGNSAYTMQADGKHLAWHHVLDLDDWLIVPAEAALLSPGKGLVGWVRSGDPVTLQEALCISGVQLTVKQIGLLGGAVPASAKKRELQELLITMCVPEGKQEEARQAVSSNQKDAANDEIDSQFSEVISDLDRDDGNAQDVKEFKQKKKRKKVLRKLAFKAQEDLVDTKRKAKAKAKAKARPGPKGFYAKLIRRSQQGLKPRPAAASWPHRFAPLAWTAILTGLQAAGGWRRRACFSPTAGRQCQLPLH